MGRPEIWKSGRKQVPLYLTPEEYQAFEEIRWREHKDKIQIARQAVLDYIKNHSEGNPAFKIDQWLVNPKFKAMPSIYAPLENWAEFYNQCNDKEKTELRIRFNDINEIARSIELNEGRKIRKVRFH